MEPVRRTLATISRYLGTLSVTQKLLIGALVVVAVLSLVVVAMTAGRTSMVELLPGVSGDQQVRAKSTLDAMNITYRAEGGKLMVPVEMRATALAALSQSGTMPADSRLMFANLAATRSWMSTRSQNEQDLNIALMNELNEVIGKFRGVEWAKVIIDAPEPVGLGTAYRKPTASVMVVTRHNAPLTREMVDAVAALVAGAKAGLSAGDVKVVDGGGRQFSARSEGEVRSGDYMEHVAAIEARVQGKLLEQLRYIGSVIVAVNAQVDIRKTSSTETRMLPQGSGSVSIVESEQTSTKSDTSGAGGGAEPGLRSNVAADINTGGGWAGGGVNSSTETTDTTFKVGIGSREERTVDPRGMPTRINVTVNVPREYIADLWRARSAASAAGGSAADAAPKEPSPQELEQTFADEKKRLEADITPLVETAVADPASGSAQPQAGRVVVSMIPVPLRSGRFGGAPGGGDGGDGYAGGGGSGGGGGGGGTIGGMLDGGLVKNVMLGALAVVALGMMMMMVRKAGKPTELPKPDDVVGLPPALQAANDIVGEADEGQTAMEGIELDDNELRSKKMLESVTELVKKAPGDSAKILNRWVVSAET